MCAQRYTLMYLHDIAKLGWLTVMPENYVDATFKLLLTVNAFASLS